MKHTKLGGKKKKTHLFKLAQKARPARHVECALPTHMQAVCSGELPNLLSCDGAAMMAMIRAVKERCEDARASEGQMPLTSCQRRCSFGLEEQGRSEDGAGEGCPGAGNVGHTG